MVRTLLRDTQPSKPPPEAGHISVRTQNGEPYASFKLSDKLHIHLEAGKFDIKILELSD